LPKQLTEKTFEAWVTLDHLKQQGGGVLTVQANDGGLFDSIVFGEQQAGHWLAGSDFFARSEPFHGPIETDADKRPVHIAIVYQTDGSIACYREGAPYGRPYRKANAAVFDADVSQVLLGCRHGKPTGNHGLQGRIHRARLYDRALTSQEIASTSRVEESSITDSDVLATLPETQRNQVIDMQSQREELMNAIESARANSNNGEPELQAWTSLAQAFINLKEFIYLR
jgi:hypothetical protein